jgi:hypothetical protein
MSIRLCTQLAASGGSQLGSTQRPTLLRGDKSWGIEPVMARAEQSELKYTPTLRESGKKSLPTAVEAILLH